MGGWNRRDTKIPWIILLGEMMHVMPMPCESSPRPRAWRNRSRHENNGRLEELHRRLGTDSRRVFLGEMSDLVWLVVVSN